MFGKAGHDEQGVVKSVSLRPDEVPMVARVNRQILLRSRPEGAPSLDNFTLKQGSVPEPGDGEVLIPETRPGIAATRNAQVGAPADGSPMTRALADSLGMADPYVPIPPTLCRRAVFEVDRPIVFFERSAKASSASSWKSRMRVWYPLPRHSGSPSKG
jgi:hypothetical protein